VSADPLEEPPFLLDAALVLRYAFLDIAAHAGEGSGVVIDGIALDLNVVDEQQPNGPDCPPVCRHGQVTIDLTN